MCTNHEIKVVDYMPQSQTKKNVKNRENIEHKKQNQLSIQTY